MPVIRMPIVDTPVPPPPPEGFPTLTVGTEGHVLWNAPNGTMTWALPSDLLAAYGLSADPTTPRAPAFEDFSQSLVKRFGRKQQEGS